MLSESHTVDAKEKGFVRNTKDTRKRRISAVRKAEKRVSDNRNGLLQTQTHIWKQWNKPRTRVRNLVKLGMEEWKAYRNGNTRKER